MNVMKLTRRLALAALVALPAGVDLMAQDVPDGSASVQSLVVTNEQARFTGSVGAGFAYQGDTDVKNSGDFSVNRFGVLGRGAFQLSPEARLGASVGYSFAAYDFHGKKGFNALKPWDDVQTLTARATFSWQIDDAWTVYGGPMFGFAAETGGDWGQGFTAGLGAGFLYKLNEKFTAGFGLAYMTEVKDDPSVFPLLRLSWQFADEWELRNTLTAAGAEGGGAGLEVAWKFRENWEATLGGQFRTSRFILDNGGAGEDRSFPILLGVSYQVQEQVNVGAFVGINAAGKVEVDRPSETRVKQQSYDPAPLVGLRGSYRF